jgi:hypothetical protein
VTLYVLGSQVIEQTTLPANQNQEPTLGSVVARMQVEMLIERLDPCIEERDLYFRRSGVGSAPGVIRDYAGLGFGV